MTLLLNEEMILSKLSLFLCFFFEIIFYFITNFISFFNFLLIFFMLLFYSILHERASCITEAADFLGRVPLMQKKKCLILQERGGTISRRKSPCTNSHKPLQEVSTTAWKSPRTILIFRERTHTAGVIEEDTYQTGHGAVESPSESPCTHFGDIQGD